MNQYRPQGFSYLPLIVKNLLIINVLLFLLKYTLLNLGVDLDEILGLHYFAASDFRIHQIVTYLFMHGDINHLFFNMFAVWMFGTQIENRWGPKRFLIYYLITGFGAAIIHYTILHFEITPILQTLQSYIENPSQQGFTELISDPTFVRYIQNISPYNENYDVYIGAVNSIVTNPVVDERALSVSSALVSDFLEYYKNQPVIVGASGSLFGILLAFGMLFPNVQLYIYFLFPVKAKWLVIAYGALELYNGIANNPGDNVAHFAHLGGMLFGFILIKYWKNKGEYV